MNPRPLALVTGASSGIGAELAVELALRGHDLLLTGRDLARLEAVADRVRAVGASAETRALDLGEPSTIAGLTSWVAERPLAVLVNNAGFGGSDPLIQADPTVLSSMIALNVTALTLITRAFVPAMVARGKGRVLNVASTASFSPIPTMAVYGASKAYVLSFSEALAEELVGSGVTVTTLCPGATTTRFAERAALGGANLFKSAMSADVVARQGLDALFRGKRVKVTGVTNGLMAFSTRTAPRSLVTKIAKAMMAKPSQGVSG